MKVSDLRESEYVESVESATRYEWSDREHWKLKPNRSLSHSDDGVRFLIQLNIVWEENGFIWLPKGNISRE